MRVYKFQVIMVSGFHFGLVQSARGIWRPRQFLQVPSLCNSLLVVRLICINRGRPRQRSWYSHSPIIFFIISPVTGPQCPSGASIQQSHSHTHWHSDRLPTLSYSHTTIYMPTHIHTRIHTHTKTHYIILKRRKVSR